MKLTKIQINAMVDKIYREIAEAIEAINKETKDTTTATFLKTDVGKAIVKVNNAFFSNPPLGEHSITKLALKYYDINLLTFPRTTQLQNDIILSTIEADNLDEIMESIKNKYINVQ